MRSLGIYGYMLYAMGFWDLGFGIRGLIGYFVSIRSWEGFGKVELGEHRGSGGVRWSGSWDSKWEVSKRGLSRNGCRI